MKQKYLQKLAVLAIAGMMLAGCGKASNTAAMYVEPPETEEPAYEAGASADAASRKTAVITNSSAAGPAYPEAMAVSDTMENTAEDSGQKIIRSGNVDIQTISYTASKKQLQSLTEKYQCQINNESESNDDWNWYIPMKNEKNSSGESSADRTYRVDLGVPAEKLDAFLDDLDGIDGHIMSKSISADNVTKTYSQNADRIAALEEEQKSLLSLMSKTDNVSDLVTIQQELANVRAQLMDLNNSNDEIDNEVQYSPITVSLDEVAVYDDDTHNMTLGEKIFNAFRSSGKGFVDFLIRLLLFISSVEKKKKKQDRLDESE